MKAVTVPSYGRVTVSEVPVPSVSAGSLLVRVHATTVNRTDCASVYGKPLFMRLLTGLFSPGNFIPGTDFAGVVEKVGEGVSRFAEGDRVFGFSDSGLGSQAEYASVPAAKVRVIPAGTDYPVAAASLEGLHYARNFLNKVEISPSSRVLVNGATGAIGSAMVQLLSAQNVPFDAVCGTSGKALVTSLGARRVFDYMKEDFTTSGFVYDFVFDAVGKSSFGACRKVLSPRGVYISSELGRFGENLFHTMSTRVSRGRRVRFPYPSDSPATVRLAAQLLFSSALMPVIDRSFRLSEACEAYSYVFSGRKIGNVVLQIAQC